MSIFIVEGTTNNIIPTPNGWPGFLDGDPNYKDTPRGIYNFNGTNLLFTPKILGTILVNGVRTLNIDALNITSDNALFLANMRAFSSYLGNITIFSKPIIKTPLIDQTVSTTGSKTITFSAETYGSDSVRDTYVWLIDGEEKESGPKSTSVPIYDFRGSLIGYNDITPYTINGSLLSFTVNGSLLSVGNHTLTIIITTTSPDGKTAIIESSSILTVTNNSVPSFTTGISTFDLFSNRTKTITVAASNAVTYTWSIDGVDKQTSVDPSYIVNGATLSAGEHTLKVVATNANGNSSSEATFMVNPVILVSVAKNSQNNIINFPVGYLLRDAPGLIFTDGLGSFEFNTAVGTLKYSPATGITSSGETLSMYDPINPRGFATIVINIVEYPVITQGLIANLALRQNETKLVSITAESQTSYKWYIDNIEKQSSVSNTFTIDGATLTIGDHTLRVDAINSNGIASSSSTVSVSDALAPPAAPANIVFYIESLQTIRVEWTSTELVQYTFDLLDNTTFVNATGSRAYVPAIVGSTSGSQLDFFPLVPQYSKIRLRAINANGASMSVTQDIIMPYTIEKHTPIGGTDQYHITAFNNATEEIYIINGITHISDLVDTRGDQSIQNITKIIDFCGDISVIGNQAFKNCSMLETIKFVGDPPKFTNSTIINGIETGYWNFAPNRLPAKVTVNYDSSIAIWDPIVTRTDPVSPYIEFSAPPFIYEQLPATANVIINTPYELTAKVYGNPILYKWYRNNVEIDNATSKLYIVNESQYDTTVNYSFRAENNLGQNNSSIAITFVTPPIINNPLENQLIPGLLTDSSHTITMDISGTATITYKWYINDVEIIGENSHILLLRGVMLPRAGANTLRFTATNAFGSTSSSTTVERIITTPIINNPLEDQTIPALLDANSYTIDMVVLTTTPIIYKWFSNDIELVGKNSSTLILTGAMLSQIGANTLRFTATNTFGSTSSSASVQKLTPPIINNPLEDQILPDLLDASSHIILMDISGTAPISYTWYINNVEIVGENSNRLEVYGEMLTQLGANTLRFTATNAFGSTSSSTTVIKVSPPTITGGVTNITLDTLPADMFVAGNGVYKIDIVDDTNTIVNIIDTIYFDVKLRRNYEIRLHDNPLRKYFFKSGNVNPLLIYFDVYDSIANRFNTDPTTFRLERFMGDGSTQNVQIDAFSFTIGTPVIVIQFPVPGFHRLIIDDASIIFEIIIGSKPDSTDNRYRLSLLNNNSSNYYIDSINEVKNISYGITDNYILGGSLPSTAKFRIQQFQSNTRYETVHTSLLNIERMNTLNILVGGTPPFTYKWKNSDGVIVGSESTLKLYYENFEINGDYTYYVEVFNKYGSATSVANVNVILREYNRINSFTADFKDMITETESFPDNHTLIVKNPGDVTFSVTVSGYPQQTIEWFVVPMEFYNMYGNPDGAPVLVQTNITAKNNTKSEVFMYTRNYANKLNLKEKIYVRITNSTGSTFSQMMCIYIPPVLKTGIDEIYYYDILDPEIFDPISMAQYYSPTQKYTVLSNNIIIGNFYIGYRYREIEEMNGLINFYKKYCSTRWEYKGLTDTDYTPLDLTADYIAKLDLPFKIAIESSKFPLLTKKGDSCIFRCITDYKDPDIIGRAISETQATAKIKNYELNASGELIFLAFGDDSIIIPPEVTKIADNFVIRSMGFNIANLYTGNARRVFNSGSIGSETEKKLNSLKTIKSIVLHKGITSIGENAFGYIEFIWRFLTYSVNTLLPNVTSIIGMPPNATIHKDAFTGLLNLEEVLFDTS